MNTLVSIVVLYGISLYVCCCLGVWAHCRGVAQAFFAWFCSLAAIFLVAGGFSLSQSIQQISSEHLYCRIWSSGKRDQADDEANAAHSAAMSELSQSISALLHLEDLCEQANRTFLQSDVKGGVVLSKDIDPNSVKLAQMAEAAARDKTEVTICVNGLSLNTSKTVCLLLACRVSLDQSQDRHTVGDTLKPCECFRMFLSTGTLSKAGDTYRPQRLPAR